MANRVRAVARYIRISPYKARLVCNLVKGMRAEEALDVLRFTPKKAARYVEKLIRSAMANAENNYGLSPADLYVVDIRADDGPRYKRVRFAARGRVRPILKRTTHLTVVLEERVSK